MKFKIKEGRHLVPVPLSQVMQEYFKETGFDSQFYIETLKRSWDDIVGSLLSVHSIPYKTFQNVLFIAVDHPIFSNDISMRKENIINDINERVFGMKILDIRVDVKKLMWKKK